MINVSTTNKAGQRIRSRIQKAVQSIEGAAMRRVMDQHGKAIVEQFRANIDAMTPGNVPDLAKSTKKQKMKKYGRVYPILKATGLMYNSMKAEVRKTTEGYAIRITYLDNRGQVAAIHIRGDGLPQRNFTKLPEALRKKLWDKIRKLKKG